MDKNTKIERLYIRHKNTIYNLILRLSNDSDFAMDVTQQTFLTLLSKDIQPPLTKLWFISIARELFYKEHDLKNTIAIENIDESTEYNFINEEFIQLPMSKALESLQAKIESSLANLTTAAKEIIILYFIENFAIISISNITKRSINDIKVNLHHACIVFEKKLVDMMNGKVAASGIQCQAYSRITAQFYYTDIPGSSIALINLHISNCRICINSNQQLKIINILLNLTPIFIAPRKIDKLIQKNLIAYLQVKKAPVNYLKLIRH